MTDEPFSDPIADLRAFLAGQEAEEARLREQLLALQDQTRRAKRAIEVLTDQKANSKRAKVNQPSTGHAWVPRQDKLDQALAALRDGATTIKEVSEWDKGMAAETARRALNHLRETEQVRITGTITVGPSKQKVPTYAVMPAAVVSDAA